MCLLVIAGLCAWSPTLSLVPSPTCSGASTPLHKATLRAFHSCRSASCHQHICHCGNCTKSAYPTYCHGYFLVTWRFHVASAVAAMATVTYLVVLGPCICAQLSWCMNAWLRCIYLGTLGVLSDTILLNAWRLLLQGKSFAELPYYFPDGSVFGLVRLE